MPLPAGLPRPSTTRRSCMRTTRRHFLTLTAGAAAAAGVRLDLAPAFAQSGPVKLGILAAKPGVLAPVRESGPRGVQWATERSNAAAGIRGRHVGPVIEPAWRR